MSKGLLTLITCLNLLLVGQVVSAQQDDTHDHQHGDMTAPVPQIEADPSHQHHTGVDDISSPAQQADGQMVVQTGQEMTDAVDHQMDHEMPLDTGQVADHANHQQAGQAMDHDMSEPSGQAMDHTMPQEMTHEMDDQSMDHAALNEPDQIEMRDPHAYSNGYGLTTGPYLLPSQRKIVLADEKTFTGLWMDRLEFVQHDVTQGAELEGFAWFGNSYRQILVQAQIETVEGTVEEGEVDLLYSQAISPFWDLRYGVHRSFGENADRDWAAIGFKGLAPYWFEVDATLHLGASGHVAFDFEVEYELLLTQRLVLQPRVDIHAFSKTDVGLGRGAGLSSIKAGARLRYELDRQFAPYLGVERVNRYGETADLMPFGRDRTETHWVAGLKFWF